MRAITYDRYGGPEVLTVREMPAPQPGPDELLIRVHAAEATKADCEMRSFRFSVYWFWLPLRLAVGVRRPRQPILGSYFAGTVESVGASVTRFQPGDEIFGASGLRRGAYGELLALPEDYPLAEKPANMTFAEAAAVPLGGLNALHFMDLADVQAGDEVLVNGAGGVIGGHGVQIAKARGAEVTAVDSGHKQPLVQRLGADRFVDYRQTDFTQTGERWDVIFDMVPGSPYGACIRALKSGGCYLTGNPRFVTMWRTVFTTRFSDKTARFRFAPETPEALEELKRLVEAGSIVPIVDQVLPMHEAARAHELVETEARKGAIVIDLTAD